MATTRLEAIAQGLEAHGYSANVIAQVISQDLDQSSDLDDSDNSFSTNTEVVVKPPPNVFSKRAGCVQRRAPIWLPLESFQKTRKQICT